MDGPQVVVEEIDVAAGDLEGSRAVAQDALEAEQVAAVLEEDPGEGVAQDVGGDTPAQGAAGSEPPKELLGSGGWGRWVRYGAVVVQC